MTATTALERVDHDYAEVNGVRLHYAHTGSGPLIMLLHGFPQCWYQYRRQLVDLADEYTVVAPDLRGCNLSEKPEDVHAYLTCEMVEDVRQLIVALGFGEAILVGHDVGGAVAWSFALHHPDLLRALVILDAAHPVLFDRALREDDEQQQASAYMLYARWADSVDLFANDDFAGLRDALDEPFIADSDMNAYAASWKQPGALAGALRWFQAEGLGPPADDGTPAKGNVVAHIVPPIVNLPTLVPYSNADRWIRPVCHQGLDRYVPDLEFIDLDAVRHWITEDQPDLVTIHIHEIIWAHPT